MSTVAKEARLVPPVVLRKYLLNLYQAYGASLADATEITDHLIEASLSGHDSHGILRTSEYIDRVLSGGADPTARPKIVKDSAAWATIDAGWGFGQPASRFATELVIAKARNTGVACVTVRNGNHMGRVGYYTSKIADEGMFGLGCVNINGAPGLVAAFGGVDRLLGTNPFSIAFPSGRSPNFVADFATSVVAEGKVRWYRNNDKPVPAGWLINPDGEQTTDPWELYKEPMAALMPLGGNKGYALCLAIEALAGALSGGDCANPEGSRHGNACWFLAIDIAAFTDFDEFIAKVSRMLDFMKTSKPRPGVDEILYPGEPEYRMRVLRLRQGIPVDPATAADLASKAKAKGVAVPDILRAGA